ncbi:MAG: hypothetical protein OEW15_05385 [Nitrospirota bacterium]|nr:hypothetical protein [Nitrospirota bacterium]
MIGVRQGRGGAGGGDLRARLAEVEQRVKNIVLDNRQLRSRVQELEQELGRAQAELQGLQVAKKKHSDVRGRLERILAVIESLKSRDREDNPESTPQE